MSYSNHYAIVQVGSRYRIVNWNPHHNNWTGWGAYALNPWTCATYAGLSGSDGRSQTECLRKLLAQYLRGKSIQAACKAIGVEPELINVPRADYYDDPTETGTIEWLEFPVNVSRLTPAQVRRAAEAAFEIEYA
jgi:hypothetical protein